MKKVLRIILVIAISILLLYVYGTRNWRKSNYYPITVFNNEAPNVGDTLTIMTYNTGWLSGMTNNLPVERDEELYKENLENVINSLNGFHQNIIACQEIDIDADRSFNYNQPDSLAKALGYKYGGLAVNWDKTFVPFPGYNPKYFFGKTVSAQYILSDLEILENNAEKLIKPINTPFYYNAFYLDRLIQKTLVKTKKGNLMILNVHLEAFDEDTRANHIKRTINVFDEYRKLMPTILLGDFNSPQWKNGGRNEFMNKLFEIDNVSNAITDSIYKQKMKKHNTYSSENPYEKIDFIFYNSDKIKAIDAGVMQEIGSPSDHFPVWMKFVML